MRKISLTAIAALALAGGGAAFAQTQQTNTYKVTASVSPKKSGSKSKPTAVSVKFGYTIGETHGLKPAAVTRYTVGLGGVRSNGRYFKTCKAGQMQGSDVDCPSAARVGTGTLQAFVYNSNDPSGGSGGFPCTKTLHIWNAGSNRAVLFIGGNPSQCGGVGNLAPISAQYISFRGNGQALRFTVPADVVHPVSGLTVAVTSVTASMARKTTTVKRKKRGYFESVARTHPVQVTFVTEQGATGTASAKG